MTAELEIYQLDLDWDLVNHLADPDSFAALRAEGIEPSLIEDEYVREVLVWAVDHFRKHKKPASPSALEDTFDEIALQPPLTAPGDLMERLRARYIKNAGRRAIKDLGELWSQDPAKVAQAMAEHAKEFARITGGKGDAWKLGDHDRAIHQYHKYVTQGQGPSFGFPELDSYFYGQRGVTFYLGPPKSMKTWIGLQGVLANVREGRRVRMASLELPAEEANMRFKCLASNIPWWKYLKGRLDPKDIKIMEQTEERLADEFGGFYEIVSPPVGQRKLNQIVQPALDDGADVLFVDQLQYLQDEKGTRLGGSNDTGAYWAVGDDLRAASQEIPISVIHQFNRSVMNSDEMPSMQQAKASSMVEEVATLVLGLWANKDMRNSNIMEIGTLATRNYGLASWEIGVTMSDGCKFVINDRIEDE